MEINSPVFSVTLEGFDALATTVGDAVIVHCGTLAVTVFRNDEDVAGSIVDAHHANDFIVGTTKGHPFHAHGGSADGASRAFMETNGLAGTQAHEDFGIPVGQACRQQLVAFSNGHGIDAIGARTAVGFEACLLDQTLLGAQDDEVAIDVFLVLQVFDRDVRQHLVVSFEVDEVDDGPSLALLASFWHFEDAHPEAPPLAVKISSQLWLVAVKMLSKKSS